MAQAMGKRGTNRKTKRGYQAHRANDKFPHDRRILRSTFIMLLSSSAFKRKQINILSCMAQ